LSSQAPSDSFLRQLYGPLFEDAQAEVEVTLKVAVAIRAEMPRAEIAERLGVTPADVRAAVKRLQGISDRIEIGERPGDVSAA
jgi:hypothetical protein